MNDRLVGMKRILKVQDQVKRMADWRVAEAERHKRDIEDAQQALATYLADTVPEGALAAAAVAQTRRLVHRGTAATENLADETRKAREAQGRQKLVERFVDALTKDERTARERKDLAALIEAFTNRAARPDPDAEPDHAET